jgi:ribosomal protein S18 acetylase RimI-like enzyme
MMPSMLFATTTVAARIERAEAEIARDFALRARAWGADVLIEPIGGTAAVHGGPGEPFNKLAGLGFAALDEQALARLESLYDARGAELRVEQSTLADPAVAALLTRRGYELIGYENVLGLELTPSLVQSLSHARAENVARGISVSRAAADETSLWIETITEGVLHPDTFDGPPPTESFDRDTLRRVFADYGAAPGCALYLVRREGRVAGAGALRISDGLAQLSGASTLPSHRRRGVQSALLRARLVDAAESGCDLAVVTTEPASKSQQNVQRAGFALLYPRAVLLRRPRQR